jgi:hypothetical protein
MISTDVSHAQNGIPMYSPAASAWDDAPGLRVTAEMQQLPRDEGSCWEDSIDSTDIWLRNTKETMISDGFWHVFDPQTCGYWMLLIPPHA